MKTFVVAAMLIAVGLAGCGDAPAAATDDVIVLSGTSVDETQEVNESETAAAPVDTSKVGHVAGFVVNEALKTIEGAQVRLKALDLLEVSDRTGKFEFVDLAPGAYIISFHMDGHEPAETVVTVKAGEFTRMKAILYRIPPPEPYVEVVKHDGFMDITNHRFATFGLMPCRGCQQVVMLSGNASAVVFEAFDNDQTGGTGTDLVVYANACCTRLVSSESTMPFWYKSGPPGVARLQVNFDPWSPTVPEMNQEFVFMTSVFYNHEPPAGYTAA